MTPREIIIPTPKGNVRIWQIDNNVNGAPRFVIHFLSLFDDYDNNNHTELRLKKYGAKWFGGGYVFTSYYTGEQLAKQVNEMIMCAIG